jgi:hypothetical protein
MDEGFFLVFSESFKSCNFPHPNESGSGRDNYGDKPYFPASVGMMFGIIGISYCQFLIISQKIKKRLSVTQEITVRSILASVFGITY